MAATRSKTTHGLTHRLTYSVARAIDVIAWQSVNAVCLCCLTHGACVKVNGIQPLLTIARWRLLISDLISKYDSLTLPPNMPCMLLVDTYAEVCDTGACTLGNEDIW